MNKISHINLAIEKSLDFVDVQSKSKNVVLYTEALLPPPSMYHLHIEIFQPLELVVSILAAENASKMSLHAPGEDHEGTM